MLINLSKKSMLELIEIRSKLFGWYNVALKKGLVRLRLKTLNWLRVVNAEIHVAQAENRI